MNHDATEHPTHAAPRTTGRSARLAISVLVAAVLAGCGARGNVDAGAAICEQPDAGDDAQLLDWDVTDAVGDELSGDADSGTSHTPTVAEVRRRIQTAMCTGRAACGEPIDIEVCADQTLGSWVPNDGSLVDFTKLEACEQAMRSCSWATDEWRGPDSCRQLIRGKLPFGSPCQGIWSCAEGECVQRSDSDEPCSFVCAPLRGLGEPCHTGRECSDSYSCINGKCAPLFSGQIGDTCESWLASYPTNPTLAGCALGTYCELATGKCTARPKLDEDCEASPVDNCSAGLWCVSKTGCTAPLPAGATCTVQPNYQHPKCGPGLRCVGTGVLGACEFSKFKKLGDGCETSAECPDYNVCRAAAIGKTCQRLPMLGQPCNEEFPCGKYALCRGGKCEEPAIGEPCTGDSCGLLLWCNAGKCDDDPMVGEPCRVIDGKKDCGLLTCGSDDKCHLPALCPP